MYIEVFVLRYKKSYIILFLYICSGRVVTDDNSSTASVVKVRHLHYANISLCHLMHESFCLVSIFVPPTNLILMIFYFARMELSPKSICLEVSITMQ